MKKVFIVLLLSLFSVTAWCNDGDIFSNEVDCKDGVHTEKINMMFIITDESSKTCAVCPKSIDSQTVGIVTIPPTASNGDVTYKVSEIKDGAFSGCKNIISVSIPASVTQIGGYAFSGCTSIEQLTLPTGLKNLGIGAFTGCVSLTSMVIPEGIASLSFTFSECSSLKEVTLPKNSLKKLDDAFHNTAITTMTLPNSVTTIGSTEFEGCTHLTYFDTGDGLTWIHDLALYGCSNLSYIRIGKNVQYQEFSEYRDTQLPALEELVIDSRWESGFIWRGSNVKKLTFGDNCTQMGYVPETVTTLKIGKNIKMEYEPYSYSVFSDLHSCNLDYIEVSEDNPYIDSRQHCNAIIETATNTLIYGSNKSTIPSSVSVIGTSAFEGRQMASIIIPEGVQEIGDAAFTGSWLETVTIPNSVVELGRYVFGGCRNLTYADLGDGVRNIYRGLFANCYKLKQIRIGKGLETFEGDSGDWYYSDYVGAFKNCPALEEAYVDCNIEITFPDNLKTLTFGDNVETINNGWLVKGLVNLKIGKNIRTIDPLAFNGAELIEKIEVSPDNTTFDSRDNCNAVIESSTKKLVLGGLSTTIPNDIVSIGDYAFFCRAMESIDIPANIQEIKSWAFNYCKKLTAVRSFIQNPLPIDGSAFSYVYSTATLYVPAGTKERYETTNGWRNFASIEEMDIDHTGDVNGDGKVDVSDYIGVANYILGSVQQEFNASAADVNGDGVIDVSDYIGIANFILTSSPYGN